MSPNTISTNGAERPHASNLVTIQPGGDVLLDLGQGALYRVSSDKLAAASPYFQRLFDPDKFGEGALLHAFRQTLKAEHGHFNFSDVPSDALPVISIGLYGLSSLGRKAHTVAASDLFYMLHGLWTPGASFSSTSHVDCLVILAALADRFNVVHLANERLNTARGEARLERLLTRRRLPEIPWPSHHEEAECRKAILAGYLLSHSSRVAFYTFNLIVTGQALQKKSSGMHGAAKAVRVDDDALWWNLPGGLEEEIAERRELILARIGRVMDDALGRYSSGKLQCRLGYSNSTMCDLFQLGQMTRFFNRKGLLSFRSRASQVDDDSAGDALLDGPIFRLIKILRECPNYQIDEHHRHCGIRKELIPELDAIEHESSLPGSIGVCGQCWKTNRLRITWTTNVQNGETRMTKLSAPSNAVDHAKCTDTGEGKRFFADRYR